MHMDMVFKSKEGDKVSHWAHIMCDPDYKSWQSIEIFEGREDHEGRITRFKENKRLGNHICAWPSCFAHIDRGPDMS